MGVELDLLGQRIANLRGRKSQRALARDAKIDVSTLSRIERGLADPSYSTLRAIAEAFGTTVTALIEPTRPNALVGSPRHSIDLDEEIQEVALDQLEAIEKAVELLAGERGVSANTRREIESLLRRRKAG